MEKKSHTNCNCLHSRKYIYIYIYSAPYNKWNSFELIICLRYCQEFNILLVFLYIFFIIISECSLYYHVCLHLSHSHCNALSLAFCVCVCVYVASLTLPSRLSFAHSNHECSLQLVCIRRTASHSTTCVPCHDGGKCKKATSKTLIGMQFMPGHKRGKIMFNNKRSHSNT